MTLEEAREQAEIPMVGKRKKKEKPSPEEAAEILTNLLRQEKVRRFAAKHDISEEAASKILAGQKREEEKKDAGE